MPSFMNSKRSRLITIAAAGTLTLATAISAAAATLPTGSAAGAADAHMLTQTVHVDTLSPAQRAVSFDTPRYGSPSATDNVRVGGREGRGRQGCRTEGGSG